MAQPATHLEWVAHRLQSLCYSARGGGRLRRASSYAKGVSEKVDSTAGVVGAGLCANCGHARVIESARGSKFVLCGLAATDARFPKYPRLPVLQCVGYSPKQT
jgi:hypothetical protein